MANSLKLKSAEEFEKLLEFLANDLFQAKVHFTIFWEMNRLAKDHREEMQRSPVFWQYTLQAHLDMTLMRVIRIYDQHSSGFHLLRFLKTIQENDWLFEKEAFLKRLAKNDEAENLYQGIPEVKQLCTDIEFVSEANPKVRTLKKWRDEIVFHKDPRHLLSNRPFESNNSLFYSDLSSLIEEGAKIVNRYANYFQATHYGNDTDSWKDADFVFESLNHHPDVVAYRKDMELIRSSSES